MSDDNAHHEAPRDRKKPFHVPQKHAEHGPEHQGGVIPRQGGGKGGKQPFRQRVARQDRHHHRPGK